MEQFSDSFQKKLHKYVCRYVDPLDADDIIQDIHLALLRCDHGAVRNPGAFAYALAARVVSDFLCRREFQTDLMSAMSAEAQSIQDENIDSSARRIDERVASQQLIERAIGTLSSRQREAFLLAYTEGFSTREIAKQLGISPLNAKYYVTRARIGLRQSLQEQTVRHGREPFPSTRFNGVLYEVTTQIALPETKISTEVTPRIQIASAALAERLKREPQSVYNLESRQFELLLRELLEDLGYRVDVTRPTRDGGKDLLAYMDTELGPLLCLVEAKKYRREHKVGVELVRSLWGSFNDIRVGAPQATRAMLVTTSSFTRDAQEFQRCHQYQLALKDYGDLERWIQRYRTRRH